MTDNEIGLSAVFKTTEFVNGLSEYLAGVHKAEGQTVTAASQITAGLATIGGSIVLGALAAATAAITIVAGAAIASIPAFLGWADTVDGIGDVLGTTSEDSSTLAVAIQSVGGNVDAITGQMAFLTKGLVTADGKIGPTGEVMNDLGIAFRDANGNILPARDILTKVADKLAGMPDGLAKTALMTRLFGKSGKDLSDTLAVLTTEGFEKASQTAKDLGLSMSEDATSGAIELGKKFEMVKMTGQGLMVSLGEELAPAVSVLVDEFMKLVKDALPKVKELLPKIAAIVMDIARFIIRAIPVVFGIISNVVNFLINNKPILIGALAAIAVAIAAWAYTMIVAAIPAIVAFITAMAPAIAVILLIAGVVAALAWAWENNFLGMRDTLTAFWETTVKPALTELWNWLSINIPLAIQTLSTFWTTILLPAILAVWAWIQANLFPLLTALWNWLATTIPAAIQVLSDFWTTILLPAITAIWGFITTSLLPLFLALANFMGAVLGLAVTVLAGLWQNVLQPALAAVWSFIQSNILPIFAELGSFISEVFGPIIQWLADFIAGVVVGAWNALRDAIASVVEWLDRVADAIRGLELPDWLTPGSPTPFELGLRGIGSALTDLANTQLPKFKAELEMSASGSGMRSSFGSNGAPTPSAANASISNTFNLGGNTLSGGMDMAVFEARVINIIDRQMRGW